MSDLLDHIIEVADQITAILEAPRGLKHPRHQYHLGPAIREVKRIMAAYFAAQKRAVVAAVKPHLQSHINQFSEASTTGRSFAASVLPTSLHPLRFAVSATEESEYGDAISGAILGAAKVLTDEMESGEVVAPNMAGNYLADNSLSKLTGDISETTTDRLRTAIADAWDKGGSYDQIVSAITDKFDDFSETRAGLIAQTEAVDAYNYGRSETARAVGLDEKSWETESDEPCETCLANEAQGWIDIDDDFDSGDSEPTAHPNCECVANYRKSSDEDEEE